MWKGGKTIMKKFEAKKMFKWIPVVIAAAVAGIQQISEQKEAERIDNMENRIAKLEEENEGDA